jgi:hypothetical protein
MAIGAHSWIYFPMDEQSCSLPELQPSCNPVAQMSFEPFSGRLRAREEKGDIFDAQLL